MAIICNNCGETNLDIDTVCSLCGTDLYYTEALPDGAVLQNRYVIEGLIKIGGMGAIYLAFDNRLNRYCAIKEMLITYGTLEDKNYAQKRFKEEAKLLSRFDHPNLPSVHDYFIENSRYYLVMSYIEGVDLNELLQTEGKPGMPEEKVIEWSIEVLQVLDISIIKTLLLYTGILNLVILCSPGMEG
jgi:serine/threonine protein kinase